MDFLVLPLWSHSRLKILQYLGLGEGHSPAAADLLRVEGLFPANTAPKTPRQHGCCLSIGLASSIPSYGIGLARGSPDVRPFSSHLPRYALAATLSRGDGEITLAMDSPAMGPPFICLPWYAPATGQVVGDTEKTG